MTGLLTGGQTPIYICNDGDCLYPNLSHITLSDHSALRTRVSVILESLVQKIYDDGEPTEEEIAQLKKLLQTKTIFDLD